MTDKIDNRTTPFADLQAQVSQSRHEAEVEARRESRRVGNPFVRSRGTYLCTADASGQCEPRPEADCPTWDGTKREIDRLVAEVRVKHPHVTEVYIAGGFDSAERLEDFEFGNYEPWVTAWHVPVWTRGSKEWQ